MKNTKEIGNAGEDMAVSHLEAIGYKIIDRNFQTRFGEIDIIAKEDDFLVFIEVKKKNSILYGSPAEMITKRKLQKISNVAKVYISSEGYTKKWRIDAVLILGKNIELLRNITI